MLIRQKNLIDEGASKDKIKVVTMDLFVQRISIKDRLKILKKLGLNKNNFIFYFVLANLIPYKMTN